MATPRIFYPECSSNQEDITLIGPAAHHLLNVLRIKPGAPVCLFNGHGIEFDATVSTIDRKKIELKINQETAVSRESSLPLYLGQGISRGERMDFTLQKAVELGVQQITPLITQHCSIKNSPEVLEKRLKHWQQVIIHACEQSGRNTLPVLHPVQFLHEWLHTKLNGSRLLLAPGGTQRIKSLPSHPEGFTILVGPEGGLSDEEIEKAKENQFVGLGLGPRILRTETAALAVFSALQAQFGDW